jgi:hypothetical protein
MAHSTLAPEDDNSDLRHNRKFGLTAGDNGHDSNLGTELRTLRFRFNPHKVGFGILPCPFTDGPDRVEDTIAIAMNYLADGKVRRDREGNK